MHFNEYSWFLVLGFRLVATPAWHLISHKILHALTHKVLHVVPGLHHAHKLIRWIAPELCMLVALIPLHVISEGGENGHEAATQE